MLGDGAQVSRADMGYMAGVDTVFSKICLMITGCLGCLGTSGYRYISGRIAIERNRDDLDPSKAT